MTIPVSPPADSQDKAKNGDSLKNKISNNTVRIAGLGQIIGDTAFLAYGATTNNFEIGSIGALGYTAGIIGTRYGNPKAEKQLAIVERELGAYLRKQGIAIPQDPSMEKLRKPGGVIDGVESFLYAYPTQLINVCFGLMGVQFARSGVQHNQKALITSGVFMIAAGLAGLLIQEKKPDPKHPPRGVWEKAKSWVQEKPLRLTGTLANVNQLFVAIDALQERKKNPGKNAYMFKLLAVAGFTLCNTMLGLSSKDSGGGAAMDSETRETLAEVSARVIAAQPKDVQDKLLEHVAGFLAAEPYVHKNAGEISALLRGKINSVQNAVATGNDWQNYVNGSAGQAPSVT